MWIMGRGVVAVLVATMLVAGTAGADNNPNGSAFRAVGWFSGHAEITESEIKCEVPTVSSAIGDGLFNMGLWNTFGVPNYTFPNVNGPFSNPCGGWIQMQNNLFGQAIQIDHVELRFKIPGARRFRQFVPARNGFPLACREFRRDNLFVGAVINPIDSGVDQSGSGSPNVAFIQMIPLVSAQMFSCLRAQYGPLSTDVFTSLPLVIRATVVGVSDAGDTFRTNTIPYTLNLRHTCGNGRIDDGEVCDPATPFLSCFEACLSGACAFTNRPCRVNPDCPGTCLGADNPNECSCVF
jgi:hypothetical protein